MFGDGNDSGIIRQAVKFILETIPSITVSCVELNKTDFYDLNDKKVKISKATQSKTKLIESYADFKVLLTKILMLRAQKPTDQNPTSSRSHLFINIELTNNKSNLTFIDLAGWEDPKTKLNIEETKFINSSLTSLNTALEKIATGYVPSFDSALCKAFKPYLNGSTEVCMLYHVSGAAIFDGLKNVKNIVASNKMGKAATKHPFRDTTNMK